MALLLEAAVLPLSLGLACEESLTVYSMLMELSLLPGQPCVPTCQRKETSHSESLPVQNAEASCKRAEGSVL